MSKSSQNKNKNTVCTDQEVRLLTFHWEVLTISLFIVTHYIMLHDSIFVYVNLLNSQNSKVDRNGIIFLIFIDKKIDLEKLSGNCSVATQLTGWAETGV